MTAVEEEVSVRPGVAATADLDRLFDELHSRGFRVIGPTVRDGAIALGEVTATGDLPRGYRDEQSPGRYRIDDKRDAELFGYAVGPHAAKSFLHPANWTLFKVIGEVDAIESVDAAKLQPLAILLRPCEVAAIEVQDKVLLGTQFSDPVYRAIRDAALIIAVNCGRPSASCFCTSMGTGPSCRTSFDISITEIPERKESRILVEAGSARGESILSALALPESTDDDVAVAVRRQKKAADVMERSIDVEGLAGLLMRNSESPHWDDVAERCLTCLNCTMVCPTCFCTTVEDGLDLSGAVAERRRLWDSCFSLSFSYIHGGSVRQSASSRYRQWMTHKLASWIDQFGTRGCVGCGRCITWCPAGIDITAEAAAMRERHVNSVETGGEA